MFEFIGKDLMLDLLVSNISYFYETFSSKSFPRAR